MNVSLWILKKVKPEFHGIETSRDLVVRRPSVNLIEAQNSADKWNVDYELGWLTFLKINTHKVK